MKRKFSSIEKILSYIFPKVIEVFGSKYNPYYEVVLDGGKLILNTKEANFSFGQLHKVFQKTFRKIDLKYRQIENVLILGFGVGSVAQILISELNAPKQMIGVEIDETILKIGYDYFGVEDIINLQLVNEDAFRYIINCTESFDLLVVDLFEELKVPDKFLNQRFFIRIGGLLKPGGIAIFNFIVNSRATEDDFNKTLVTLKRIFLKVSVFKTMGINRVFIIENTPPRIIQF